MQEKTNDGHAPINNFIFPYYPSYAYSPGSTDVGDVSWLTPTAQFNTATWPSGSPGHSWQNVSVGKSGIAHKGMLLAAKVLAASCADLMEKPELLAEAKAEFTVAANGGWRGDKDMEIPIIFWGSSYSIATHRHLREVCQDMGITEYEKTGFSEHQVLPDAMLH